MGYMKIQDYDVVLPYSSTVCPLLIWDGDCNFCRLSVEFFHDLVGGYVDHAPYQQVAAQYPHILEEDFRRAVQLVHVDGHVSSGAQAMFDAFSYVPRLRWVVSVYYRLPGFASLAEVIYRFVASHRSLISNLLCSISFPNTLAKGISSNEGDSVSKRE